MDAIKNGVGPIEDETDEFEVISRDEDQEALKTYDVTYEQTHDDVASTVCDEEGGLDRAEDSAVPSRCGSLLHSMCSMTPFSVDSSQYEKVLEVVKEEGEKNRSMLEQISSMVEQLTKEKSDNAELRVKVVNYETRIKQLEEQLANLNTSIKDQKESSRGQLQAITVELNNLSTWNSQKDDRITDLIQTTSEKDRRILELEQQVQANAEEASANASELENAQKALEKQQRENASQAEIIRLLQEEIAEGERMLVKARKDYRDKIDELSEQFFNQNYRGEVNH